VQSVDDRLADLWKITVRLTSNVAGAVLASLSRVTRGV
jgi:hypothetical protein